MRSQAAATSPWCARRLRQERQQHTLLAACNSGAGNYQLAGAAQPSLPSAPTALLPACALRPSHLCCTAGCAGCPARGRCPLLPPAERGRGLRAAREWERSTHDMHGGQRVGAVTDRLQQAQCTVARGGSWAVYQQALPQHPPTTTAALLLRARHSTACFSRTRHSGAHPCCAATPAWRRRAPPSSWAPCGWWPHRWASGAPDKVQEGRVARGVVHRLHAWAPGGTTLLAQAACKRQARRVSSSIRSIAASWQRNTFSTRWPDTHC